MSLSSKGWMTFISFSFLFYQDPRRGGYKSNKTRWVTKQWNPQYISTINSTDFSTIFPQVISFFGWAGIVLYNSQWHSCRRLIQKVTMLVCNRMARAKKPKNQGSGVNKFVRVKAPFIRNKTCRKWRLHRWRLCAGPSPDAILALFSAWTERVQTSQFCLTWKNNNAWGETESRETITF